MKGGLWRIDTGEETAFTSGNKRDWAKFASRRDWALATIVLAVDTSLLYLTGNPEDPVVFWKKLADQSEKETWAGLVSQTALIEIKGRWFSTRAH